MINTSNDKEYQQSSPTSKTRKYFEVRRISYQSKQPKTPNSLDSKSHNNINIRASSKSTQRNSSISPKKTRDFQSLRIYKAISQQDFDSIPLCTEKTYYNERIHWTKRKKGDLPLCIINFNGIIGDYFKYNYWSLEEQRFHLVEGVKPGLKVLMSEFYVVIVSWYSREITSYMLNLLNETNLEVDAVYIVRHRGLKYRFRHNYTQIYDDFGVVNISSQVLLIASIGILRDDLIGRKGNEIFYESSSSGCNKYSTIGLPTTCLQCSEAPLTILIPHYRLSEEHISFFELSKFIYQLKVNCLSDFENAECDGFISLPCEHKEIPIIPVFPIENDSRVNRYILFMQCKKLRSRPPIMRKSSRITST